MRCGFPADVVEASLDRDLSAEEGNGQRPNMTSTRVWSQTASRKESPRQFQTSSLLVIRMTVIPEERR